MDSICGFGLKIKTNTVYKSNKSKCWINKKEEDIFKKALTLPPEVSYKDSWYLRDVGKHGIVTYCPLFPITFVVPLTKDCFESKN